jgi:DNA-binding MarR family transcriptional regulator
MLPSNLKLLHFSSALRRISTRYKLRDQKDVMVLEAVLTAYAEGTSISVLDLILRKEIASQATLHSILKNLIEKKLIRSEASKEDGRRKHVTPAKQGLAWLEDCTELLCSVSRK